MGIHGSEVSCHLRREKGSEVRSFACGTEFYDQRDGERNKYIRCKAPPRKDFGSAFDFGTVADIRKENAWMQFLDEHLQPDGGPRAAAVLNIAPSDSASEPDWSEFSDKAGYSHRNSPGGSRGDSAEHSQCDSSGSDRADSPGEVRAESSSSRSGGGRGACGGNSPGGMSKAGGAQVNAEQRARADSSDAGDSDMSGMYHLSLCDSS